MVSPCEICSENFKINAQITYKLVLSKFAALPYMVTATVIYTLVSSSFWLAVHMGICDGLQTL